MREPQTRGDRLVALGCAAALLVSAVVAVAATYGVFRLLDWIV